MSSPYINSSIFFQTNPEPTSSTPDPQSIERRRRMAQQLLQQGQEPLQGQMVSGYYVAPSWTQQLNKAFQSYLGGSAMKQADTEEKDYKSKKQKAIADILIGQQPQQIKIGETTQTTTQPYTPEQMDRFGSPMPGVQRESTTTTTPQYRGETPEEIQARLRPMIYQATSDYGNDPALHMALNDLNYQRQRGDTRADLMEGRTYAEGREDLHRQQQLQDIQNQQEFQRIMAKEQQGFQLSQQERGFQQQYKVMQAQQGFQASQAANQRNFQAGENALTRQATVDAASAKNQVPATQKLNDANDVLGILQQAAPLINKSTGSGVGALWDSAQNFLGGTNKGAIAASQLKALEGLLVSKMPKMSGPQSDKDVLLYKQMAGQIGDPYIPAAQKRAAMETINEINSRYLGLKPQSLNFDSKASLPGLNVDQNLIQQELNRRGAGWAIEKVNQE